MAYATIAGSKEMGSRIKNQRKALGLTIEEAARRAHVGTKTWCRYESGEAIRAYKWKGVCKALNWMQIEDTGDEKERIWERLAARCLPIYCRSSLL